VRDVYVEGEQVVRDGMVLKIDVGAALDTLDRAQAATLATTAERDWAHRSVDEMSPRVFRVRERLAQQPPHARR
jgi:5-methylthioadenosine/S-adenosylhomocysteine deaminase